MKAKKVLAMLMASAMIMGTSVTAFAAGTKPVATDAEKVTIQNVESGATLTAYQIIDASYDQYGFTGYVWASGTSDAGTKVTDAEQQVTSNMITALAKDPSGLTKKENFNPTTDKLEVGTWMILVTPPTENPEKIYNPMIVSVYYNVQGTGQENTVTGGTVNADDNWELKTTDAYAKSTKITIEKKVDDEDKFAEVGSEVGYTITGTIPSYSAEYTKVVYKITDTIKNGLEYTEAAPIVKVNGDTLTNGDQYTYTNNGNSFVIEFKESYVKSLANATKEARAVEVTYKAKVTAAAITKIGENEVTLDYTHKPGESTSAKKDTEYTYTFELNGVVEKVDEQQNGLAGAEFTLYKDEELTEIFNTCVTSQDNNYTINFSGLDADGTYYLKETKAPNGYSINDHIYKITFGDFKYEGDDSENGKLLSYKVYVDGEEAANINYGTPATNVGEQVVNTKLSSLPSTGGIGTTIFTIGGCAIMVTAAGLYFATRKKTEK